MKVVVLVSGGMDSVTALHHAAREHEVVAGLSFDYGSKHNARELPWARRHCEALGVPHEIVELPFVGRLFRSHLLESGGAIPDGHYEAETMKLTVVPFRNGILLGIAAGYAESVWAGGVVIAAHSGDHAIYPDCREAFMAPMADALREGTDARIELLRPFIDRRKEDIVGLGAALGIDYAQTWSCYKGDEVHCGTCGTCTERKEAFALAGLADPTVYAG